MARNEKLIKEKKAAIEKRRSERKATRAALKARTVKYAEEYEGESTALKALNSGSSPTNDELMNYFVIF